MDALRTIVSVTRKGDGLTGILQEFQIGECVFAVQLSFIERKHFSSNKTLTK